MKAPKPSGLSSTITFAAIPHPLPGIDQAALVKKSTTVRTARLAMEAIKEGASPQKDSATSMYKAAVADLESYEDMLRKTVGVQVTRPELYSRHQ